MKDVRYISIPTLVVLEISLYYLLAVQFKFYSIMYIAVTYLISICVFLNQIYIYRRIKISHRRLTMVFSTFLLTFSAERALIILREVKDFPFYIGVSYLLIVTVLILISLSQIFITEREGIKKLDYMGYA